MEIITIKSKTDGKYPKVTSEAGKSYGTKDSTAFEIGKTYEVECSERTVSMLNGKSFVAKDITASKLVVPPAAPGPRDAAIKENMDFKDKGIRECSALGNASQFVTAVATVWAATDEVKGMTIAEIVTKIDRIKVYELNRNRREFGLPEFEVIEAPDNIPF